MRSKVKSAGISLLILIWTSVLIGIYYVFHKPITLEQVIGILTSFWALLLAFLLVVLAGGVGKLLLRLMKLELSRRSEKVVLEAGLGFGALGLIWLGISWLGLLSIWSAALLVIALILFAGRSGLKWGSDMIRELIPFRPRSPLEFGLFLFITSMILISLVQALSPPDAWDSLVYHLTIPKINLANRALVFDPSLPQIGFPQLTEMLFSWFLLLGSDRAPAVLHWCFGVLTLGLVWSWGNRWSRLTGYIAGSFLLSAATYGSLMGRAYIDLSTTLFTCLGFTVLQAWRENDDQRLLFLSGVLAGFVFSTKYTGVVIGIALAAIVIARQPRWALRNLLVFGSGAVLVGIPWLLKNFVLTGNPTYPFFFNGLGWDRFRAEWYSQPGTGLLASNPAAFIAAPLLMTLVGSEGADVWNATFGPLFLVFVPFIFLKWKQHESRGWIKDALVFAGIAYLFWLVGAGISRLLVTPRLIFPVLPVLSVVASISALAMADFKLGQIRISRVLSVLVGLVLILTFFSSFTVLLQDQSIPVALGLMDKKEFLYNKLGWYFAGIEAINQLDDESQVIFLFEPRSYYCQARKCQPDALLDRWYQLVNTESTMEEIRSSWLESGFTHVFFFQLGAQYLRDSAQDPLSLQNWETLDQLRSQHLSVLANYGDVYLLYEIVPGDG